MHLFEIKKEIRQTPGLCFIKIVSPGVIEPFVVVFVLLLDCTLSGYFSTLALGFIRYYTMKIHNHGILKDYLSVPGNASLKTVVD